MKRKPILLFLTLILAIFLTLTSCEEGQDNENMKIILEKDVSRTIIPDGGADSLNITSYQVHVTGGNANYEFNSARTSMVLEGVPIGQYTITAKGLNKAREALVQGSVEFNLNRSNTTATVILEELIGDGNLNLTFSWDNNRIEKSATVKVTLQGEDSSYSVSEELKGEGNTASFIKNKLKSGSYIVKAELYDGSVKVSGASEAIRIVNGKTTTGRISFALDKLPDTVGQLTLINKAGVPVVCQILGISNGGNVVAQKEITASLDVSTLNEDELNIKWYLDGEYKGEGTSYTFAPSPGEHRLDVIARTNMLASSGSTQVVFNASILGKQGEPVIAGVISNGDVAIGGRNTMTFLSDGNLLITSDGERKITVASIVRNTLTTVSSLDFTRNVKYAATVNGGKNLVLLHDSPAGSTLFDYNTASSTITNPVHETGYYSAANPASDGVLGIINTATWMKAADFAYGVYLNHNAYGERSAILLRDIDQKGSLEKGKYYVGNRMFPQDSAEGLGSFMASSQDGNEFVIVNNKTGNIIAGKNISGSLGTNVFSDEDVKDTTAAVILPSSSTYTIRLALAKGNEIIFYEIDVDNKSYAKGGTAITRSEGSSFNTTKMILSQNGSFLYLLNTGNNSISTYAVSPTSLTFVAKSDLSFAPSEAVLSPSGGYLFVCANDSTTITMMKIKTNAD